MIITPEQVKEARRLLGWSQLELRLIARMASETVLKVEHGQSVSIRTYKKLLGVFEAAGVEFSGADALGVRLNKAKPVPAPEMVYSPNRRMERARAGILRLVSAVRGRSDRRWQRAGRCGAILATAGDDSSGAWLSSRLFCSTYRRRSGSPIGRYGRRVLDRYRWRTHE